MPITTIPTTTATTLFWVLLLKAAPLSGGLCHESVYCKYKHTIRPLEITVNITMYTKIVPAVSKNTLKIVSAFVWLSGATVLLLKGASLFAQAIALKPGEPWATRDCGKHSGRHSMSS